MRHPQLKTFTNDPTEPSQEQEQEVMTMHRRTVKLAARARTSSCRLRGVLAREDRERGSLSAEWIWIIVAIIGIAVAVAAAVVAFTDRQIALLP